MIFALGAERRAMSRAASATIGRNEHNTVYDPEASMLRAEVAIINKLGLHARASAKLAQLAGNFAADVWLERNERRVNARSIMGLMMLAASRGTVVVIEAEGEDAQEALKCIVELIADRFGEEE
jgi:phosphocarrier protein